MPENKSSMADTLAVELNGIRKEFDGVVAVDGLDLRIPRGSTYGLLGPNGAGKTTTIRMILRIIDADAGGISVAGEPLSANSLDLIGYLPEERGIYKNMKLRRLLTFFAELKGMNARESKPRITQWLERFDLADRADARVKELSKGNQQKIQFISAILHEPEIMILDEPFSGLDPINQQILKDIIVDLKKAGKTIIFSTHIIEHAERICDHVCILAKGRKVADGTIPQVKKQHGGDYLAIAFEQSTAAHIDEVRRHPAIAAVRENHGIVEADLRPDGDAQQVLKTLVERGIRLKRFEQSEPSLEQIFLDKVGASDDMMKEVRASHV